MFLAIGVKDNYSQNFKYSSKREACEYEKLYIASLKPDYTILKH